MELLSMDIVPDLAAEATYYATALGWRVIPCHTPTPEGGCSCGSPNCKKPGKHPRLAKWQHQATTDPEQIAKWWGQWPDANVGVALGPASRIFDIEYDDAEGEATAEELLTGTLTLKFRSQRSTHHLFYLPEGLTPPKAVLHWRGLELRFGTDKAGALSIFPPSLHASGIRYEWLKGPRKFGLADAPVWLADAIGGATQAKTPPIASTPLLPAEGLSLVMQGDRETLDTAPGESEGHRHRKLLELVGRYLGTYGANAELATLALAWGARCSPPMEANEVLGVVAKLADREQGKLSESIGKKQVVGGLGLTTTATPPPPPKPRRVLARPYESIEATDVFWLWQDRIALGKLSLLVGEPGLGKTFAAIDIAAHVSTGEPFIDGATPPRGEVAILTAEDGAGDTLRPRLDAAGADVSRVLHIDGVGVDNAAFPSLKDDLGPLEQFFVERPELRLLVVDPISAFLGDKVDSHNNTACRAVLGPLCELLERYRVAMLGITHLSKGQAKAVNRVIGSIAFIAAARAGWLVAKDPDNEDRRLFLPVKNNLGVSHGLAYSIVEGRCQWEAGEVLISADDIDDDENTPRDEAKRWLADKLAGGPYPAKKLLAEARGEGVAEKTLRRAQKDLGVLSERYADAWVWRLPNDPTPPAGPGLLIVQ
jgi:hypothetical protein